MSYRNKTYVAFASEDIHCYRLMEAWVANQHIDFEFFDAHDLFEARDTSQPESIKARLRERIRNAKQVVLLGSPNGRQKGGNGTSFLAYEVAAAIRLNLPVVVANLNGSKSIDRSLIPQPLLSADYYTVSVSFQPAIIKYALDSYVQNFLTTARSGPHYYKDEIYRGLGIS